MSNRKNNPVVQEVNVVEIARIAELEAKIAQLEALLNAAPKSDGSLRKAEVLTVLQRGPASVKTIATELKISTRNVSSVLTGLRKAGYLIHTDEQSRKYLISEPGSAPELEETEETEEFSDDVEDSDTE